MLVVLMGFCFASNRALKKFPLPSLLSPDVRYPFVKRRRKESPAFRQTQDEWRMSNHRQLFSSFSTATSPTPKKVDFRKKSFRKTPFENSTC